LLAAGVTLSPMPLRAKRTIRVEHRAARTEVAARRRQWHAAARVEARVMAEVYDRLTRRPGARSAA